MTNDVAAIRIFRAGRRETEEEQGKTLQGNKEVRKMAEKNNHRMDS